MKSLVVRPLLYSCKPTFPQRCCRAEHLLGITPIAKSASQGRSALQGKRCTWQSSMQHTVVQHSGVGHFIHTKVSHFSSKGSGATASRSRLHLGMLHSEHACIYAARACTTRQLRSMLACGPCHTASEQSPMTSLQFPATHTTSGGSPDGW